MRSKAGKLPPVALALAIAGPAGADLLEIKLGFPLLTYNNLGQTSYVRQTGLFAIDAAPLSLRVTPGARPREVIPTTEGSERSLRLRVIVDETGALVGGVEGPDLAVIGAVDADGDGNLDYDGSLLEGEVLAFGFLDGPLDAQGGTDQFNFRFLLTGGLMAALYGTDDTGITATSEMSTFEGFTEDFTGQATGFVGPIPSFGACCRLDRVCEEAVTRAACEDAGGVFAGSTTPCDAVTCLADLDCSGAVDLGDLLALLSAWGPCKLCRADLDADGRAGVTDLLIVLAAWGDCQSAP